MKKSFVTVYSREYKYTATSVEFIVEHSNKINRDDLRNMFSAVTHYNVGISKVCGRKAKVYSFENAVAFIKRIKLTREVTDINYEYYLELEHKFFEEPFNMRYSEYFGCNTFFNGASVSTIEELFPDDCVRKSINGTPYIGGEFRMIRLEDSWGLFRKRCRAITTHRTETL